MTRFRWDRPAARYVLALLFSVTAPTGFANAAAPAGDVRIHYHRDAGDYDGWQLYTWDGAVNRSPQWNPAWPPNGTDGFGVYYDVAVDTTYTGLNFILHDASGNNKNCPSDMFFPFPQGIANGAEIWQLQDDCTIYTSVPAFKVGNVNQAKAHWLVPDTIAWPQANPANNYRLYYAADGGITSDQSGVSGGASIPLFVVPGGLSKALKQKYPFIASATALTLRTRDLPAVPQILKGQVVVASFDGSGNLVDATALQIPGVLDSLCTYSGKLGAVIEQRPASDDGDRGAPGGLQFRLWAPTARSVNLYLYDSPSSSRPSIVPMSWSSRTCVWTADGDSNWANRKYYKYEVKVFVRLTGKVETNLVTDPYSLGLSVDSQRSLVTDLRSPETMPLGWGDGSRAKGESARQGGGPLSVYELHIRDFSISDTSVPQPDRGKFLAFGDRRSRGMTHLGELAKAGLTYVHLLPSFDIATVPEDPRQQVTPVIPNAPADSDAQQAAIAPVRDSDGFNWGYDPWHYTVPEGSYASDANGVARIREYRAMVKGLHDAGLKVIMDVVYNHTTASGQDAKSVLDRIVPGYYHRLNAVGNVLTDSCCSDTAAEHAMFEKLMIDSTETWTREYQVDGYRFDLMSFHPKSTMLKLRANLQRFDPDVYIYGEGWNFGAVGNNARFVQASQLNLAGTSIGTFSDRLRDAVRGGGPFDGGDSFVRNQGFINGLWYDNNDVAGPQTTAQKDTLLHLRDLIMVGLAGNLKDYPLVDKDGSLKLGSQIDYFGQPAGYTGSPRENIVYASAHDNQTLFDISQYKLPVGTSRADRVRAQTLGLSIIALAQGVSFLHAGDDLLRSKSFDNNSYNSGDWFNRIDFTYQSDNWGVGLPPAWSNDSTNNWPVMAPFLRNANLKPGFTEIDQARRNFLDLLEIRTSSPLFNLATAADVIGRVRFYNTGPTQNPALIVMAISGGAGHGDDAGNGLIVFFNANKRPVAYIPQTGGHADYASALVRLHPVQRTGADDVVKGSTFDPATGTFNIPARTTAAFVVGNPGND
ncbi:MAG TPA: pullulanase-type alpha-1,6-glucosidase [Myxococcales bacterium]